MQGGACKEHFLGLFLVKGSRGRVFIFVSDSSLRMSEIHSNVFDFSELEVEFSELKTIRYSSRSEEAGGLVPHPVGRSDTAGCPARSSNLFDFDGESGRRSITQRVSKDGYAVLSYHCHIPIRHCQTYSFIRHTEHDDAAVAQSLAKRC